MADGRKNNGGHSTKGKAGRPSKAEEQKLIEKLTPLAPKAHKALEIAVTEQEQWAVKLFFEYFYGKPNQKVVNENFNHDLKEYSSEEREQEIKRLLKKANA